LLALAIRQLLPRGLDYQGNLASRLAEPLGSSKQEAGSRAGKANRMSPFFIYYY
jgi:hypothetical protein